LPLYAFQIDVSAPPYVVSERLQTVVRDAPTLREHFQWARTGVRPPGPPFIGKAWENSFKLRRDVGYRRNAFLPRIPGIVVATPMGSRVRGIMFLHPFIALIMALLLGVLGHAAWMARSGAGPAAVEWGMFLLGVAFIGSGFFPEARLAKKMISAALLDQTKYSAQ
jgi:hypothetical protein